MLVVGLIFLFRPPPICIIMITTWITYLRLPIIVLFQIIILSEIWFVTVFIPNLYHVNGLSHPRDPPVHIIKFFITAAKPSEAASPFAFPLVTSTRGLWYSLECSENSSINALLFGGSFLVIGPWESRSWRVLTLIPSEKVEISCCMLRSCWGKLQSNPL